MKDANLQAFIRRERQRLIAYVRALLRETAAMDAEDIVHDVLVRILEKADLLLPEDHLAAYVYRALRNRVIDAARARRPTLSLEQGSAAGGGRLMDIIRDLRPGAPELLQSREGMEALFAALDGLAEMERRVIIAHELDGIPFREMARQWGVPINTLLSHKSRALKKLRRHFQDVIGGGV